MARFAFIVFALFMTSALGQAPKSPCESPEAAQFDFWIGDWDVFDPAGKQVGTNRIERLYACGVHENWEGGKLKGQSFNRWVPGRRVWHQTWADSAGGLLLLEGSFRDGAMILSDATVPGRKDTAAVNEIQWTPSPDGSVRQLWRVTPDGGATWKVVFDGRYVRSARPQPPR